MGLAEQDTRKALEFFTAATHHVHKHLTLRALTFYLCQQIHPVFFSYLYGVFATRAGFQADEVEFLVVFLFKGYLVLQLLDSQDEVCKLNFRTIGVFLKIPDNI